jgi:hypothetical protein
VLGKPHIPAALSRFALSPLSLLLLVSLLFYDVLRGRLMFAPYPRPTEFLSQWYPYFLFLREAIRAGEFPLWCHNLQAGFPLGAFPHAGQFYPLALPFAILGFVPAYTLFIWLHLAARIFFMHGFLREWPLPPFAAWLGAAIYVLAGSSLHVTGHLVMFTATAWVPGLFWLALRLVRHGRRRDFLLLSLVSALAYLSGDLEILLYAWIILILILVYVEAAPARALARPVLAGAAGLLLAAAPFLLTLNYLHHSFRQAQAFNPFSTQWRVIAAIAAAPWITFSSLPMIGQKYWWYAGCLLPLGFLASLADPEPRHRRLLGLTLVLVAGGVLFAANLWPLSLLFNSLPVLKFAGSDMRFRVFFPLLSLILPAAGAGFTRLTAGIGRRTQLLLGAFTIFFIILQSAAAAAELRLGSADLPVIASRGLLMAALIVLAVLLVRARRAAVRPAVRPAALAVILFLDLYVLAVVAVPRTDPQALQPPLDIPALAKPHVPDRLHLASVLYDDPDMWRFFRLDRGPGFFFGFVRNGLERHTELYLTIIRNYALHPFDPAVISPDHLPLLDFLAVRYLLSNQAPVWGSDRLSLASPSLKSAYHRQGQYAGIRPPLGPGGSRLDPGSAWTVTVALMPGDALQMTAAPPDPAQLTVGLARGNTTLDRPWSAAEPADAPRRGTLPLTVPDPGEYQLSLRLAASSAPLDLGDPLIVNARRPFEPVPIGPLQLYQNREALDHYGLYTAVIPAPKAEARALLFDPRRFDPARLLILAPEFISPAIAATGSSPRRRGEVKVREYTDNRVVLETDLAAPAYLSIAESYYPGWRAEVNGRAARIVPADYAYQAVPLLQPGPQRITLKFIPVEFGLGLWISLATAAMALVMVRIWKR